MIHCKGTSRASSRNEVIVALWTINGSLGSRVEAPRGSDWRSFGDRSHASRCRIRHALASTEAIGADISSTAAAKVDGRGVSTVPIVFTIDPACERATVSHLPSVVLLWVVSGGTTAEGRTIVGVVTIVRSEVAVATTGVVEGAETESDAGDGNVRASGGFGVTSRRLWMRKCDIV